MAEKDISQGENLTEKTTLEMSLKKSLGEYSRQKDGISGMQKQRKQEGSWPTWEKW